jgi:hypothetical protein
MDEMLLALTRGIGVELSKKVRFSYYEKKRLVLSDDLYKSMYSKKQTLMLDLLALAIFHEYAIGPLHGSNNFFSQTKRYGVRSINMGSYNIDKKFNKKTTSITKTFFAIMSEYNIEIHQLSIPSIHEFLQKNIEFIDKWQG